IELIEACICALRKQPFELFPDFHTGGLIDVSDYRDGLRGGKVRVRADVEIVKAKLIRIGSIPFGTTTGGVMDSIVSANDKGKIKISKIEDNTAENVEILVHLPAGADAETTREALYAFTDCEVSISPNACVIHDGQPHFMPVSEILKNCAFLTKDLLLKELEILLGELNEKWHFSSLEKIFIENRIYRDIEECETWEAVIEAIDKGLGPFKKLLKREVTRDDIIRLTEIKIKRISKYDGFRANEEIRGLEDRIEETEKHIKNITRYSIAYFKSLIKKYGKGRERKTELAEFGVVKRSAVVVASETLYLDRKNGFAGISLKKEDALEKCSTLDDIIIFSLDAEMRVTKVADKIFVGKRPVHVSVFRKDGPKVYSMIYREGREGPYYAKRFKAGGVTRDKIYKMGKGTKGSRVMYFAVHDTEEASAANTVVVHLKPALRLRNVSRPFSFGEIALKGRGSRGNIVTKLNVDRIVRAIATDFGES
ncbi:DNA topoisomerase, partial [bacterium]|nr:DNA topoisomerase [bacterium]